MMQPCREKAGAWRRFAVTDEARADGDVEIRDEGPAIRATVRVGDCTPGEALAAFTEPAVLYRWWGGDLIADLRPGGDYSVAFRGIAARLTGTVIKYLPGSSLVFSWAWEGEDSAPASTVTVTASPGLGGQPTVLTIEHAPHADDEAGRTARTQHRAGWEFFLPRLPQAVTPGGHAG
jgi:uncharacterized protein YndB with AHSA1/START domain